MIKRSLAFILLVAGTLVPAAGAFAQQPPTPPSAGSIGVRLLEAPVARQNDPRAREYIVDHISEGTTISRRMEVVNGTTERQTFQLYAGGAKITGGLFSTLDGHTGVLSCSVTDQDQVTAAHEVAVTLVTSNGT